MDTESLIAQLARPAGRIGRRWWGLAVPVVAAVALAVGELVAAPAGNRTGLILGQTSWRCVVAIPLLGLPIFLALVWAFRELAPTRLGFAGAACGLLAGSVAAGVYAPACPEASTAFMVTWYTFGIVSTGAIGAVFGPHALRW